MNTNKNVIVNINRPRNKNMNANITRAPAPWAWFWPLTLTTHCDDTLAMICMAPVDEALWRHIPWRRIAPWRRIVTTHSLTTHYPFTTHSDDTFPDEPLPADDTVSTDDAVLFPFQDPPVSKTCLSVQRFFRLFPFLKVQVLPFQTLLFRFQLFSSVSKAYLSDSRLFSSKSFLPV